MTRKTKGFVSLFAAYVISPALAMLWAVFAASTWTAWRNTGNPFAFLLFAVNTLFALLFILRRNSNETSSDIRDWLITGATVMLSFSLSVTPERVPAAIPLQVLGMLIILISLGCLGRSFGLVPANRGIKTGGMYALVRHPLYSGQLLFYLGFVIDNFTASNTILLVAIFIGLNLRATAEERLLRHDSAYAEYLGKVHCRFFPKLY